MRKNLNTIIFHGSLWGLIEATLGYILHSLSLKVGWFFWFPLSFIILNNVYKRTYKASTIIFTSFIASAIKLTNLLLPTRLDKVINPAVSIILEGLSIYLIFKFIENRNEFKIKALDIFIASFGWRTFYTIYILLMPSFFYSVSSLREPRLYANYLLIEGFINGMIVFGFVKAKEKIKPFSNKLELKTSLTFITLTTAVLVQIFL